MRMRKAGTVELHPKLGRVPDTYQEPAMFLVLNVPMCVVFLLEWPDISNEPETSSLYTRVPYLAKATKKYASSEHGLYKHC